MRRNREWEVREPNSSDVRARLAELGIPAEVLSEAVRAGHDYGEFVTAAHPRTYQGLVIWGETTAVLRYGLSAFGWTLDDTDNISRVVSPEGDVTIVAISGNENTGLRNKHEQLNTRRRRGPGGVRIINQNTQYALALDVVSRANNDRVGSLGTWFLLYFRAGDVVRSELSYAKAVDNSGELMDWKERLILPDIDLGGPTPSLDARPAPPDVEVHISRRG